MPQARDEAGNIWETDAQGNAVRLVSAAGAATPADPGKALDLRVKEASIANMNADNARADREANKPPSGYMWTPAGSLAPIPGGPSDPATLAAATKPALTAKERADAIAGYNSATSLDRIIAQLEAQYKAGPGSTSGVMGLQDYLPTDANRQFDSTGNAARGIVGSALGFTGGQLNTATEAAMAVGPYLPQAGDRDAVILDKIGRLRELANDARARSTAILGGVPDANGRITPLAEQAQDERRPVPGVSLQGLGTNVGGMGSPTLPGGGQSFSTEADIAIQQRLNDAYARGASFDELNRISVDAGRGNLPQGYRDAVQSRDAGRPYGAGAPPTSGTTGALNDIARNPLGAAGLGYLDAASFGVPSLLNRDAVDQARDNSPLATLAGNVGGALTGTGLIASAGRNTIGRAAPSLLTRGGARGMFGRQLATDATYGAGYGGVANNDPLGGATAAGLGSVLGQGAAGALGLAARGVAMTPAAERLAASNIPLTVGQSVGGIAKSIEDRLSGLPVIGDMVNARRAEGLRAFNQTAFGDVTGGPTANIGPRGIEELQGRISGAGGLYDQATSGVTVPVSSQLTDDLALAGAAGAGLPPDLAQRFALAMRNRIDPVIESGQMTGNEFQQMQRALKGYRAETPKAGFEADYRDALGMVSDALDANMRAQGGASVVQGLDAANDAYRNMKVLGNAVSAARNGSRTGEVEIFAPSQLNDASIANARKFGGTEATTNRPFYDLATSGQATLPSRVPDSGTAGRLATLALPGALGGAGYGVDSLTGGDSGLTTGLVLGAALTAGGTKNAQKALSKLLTSRPNSLVSAGRKIGQRKGMFGSALAPLLIEETRP